MYLHGSATKNRLCTLHIAALNPELMMTTTRVVAHLQPILVLLTLIVAPSDAAVANGSVVQCIVYAEQQADVTKVFPGAHVDHTWNNLFVVNFWTNDPDTLIKELQKQLEANADTLQTVVPPIQIAAATQKWIEYNLVWVMLMVLLFLTGCACGGATVAKCHAMRHAMAKPYMPI